MKILKHISPHTWAVVIKSFAVAGGILVVFMLFKINAQAKQIAKQAKNIAMQNNQIAKDNQHTAKESAAHIDCIAELFARYTREGQPITIDNLNTCQATASAKADPNWTPSVSSPSPQPASSGSSGAQPTTSSGGQTTQPTAPTPTPSPDPAPQANCTAVLPIIHTCVKL